LISEDTYNRTSQLHHCVVHNDVDGGDGGGGGSGTLTADPSKREVGVVCSNEDLKAIVYLHKRRHSPAVSPTTEFAAGGTPSFGTLSVGTSSVVSPRPDDMADWSVSFTVGDVPTVDAGSSASLTQPSMTSLSFIEEDSASSECSMSAGVTPVLAGFTPTVASITEQMSLEIIESTDNLHTTAPPSGPASKTVPAMPPDVVYDEHGQTWDIYGAEFDPVILGQAIQSYLQKIMARKAQSAAAGNMTDQRRTSSEKLTLEEATSNEEMSCQSRAAGRDSSTGTAPRVLRVTGLESR